MQLCACVLFVCVCVIVIVIVVGGGVGLCVFNARNIRYHPDKNTGEMQDKAQQIFLEIVAAWNILGTPDKRAAFDDFGRDGEQRSFNSCAS